jgi:heme exporter protein B
MNALWTIVAKDLRTELRLRQVLPTMFLLALVLVTVFGLAADAESRRSSETTAALLWLAFAFAALLAAERAFASEKESRTMAALLAAPISRRTVFVAKCLSSAAMLLAVELCIAPLAAVFFEVSLSGPAWALIALLLLGDAALVVLGTLAGAMVAAARTRGSLLAVLVLPLLVPVLLITAVCAAELAARGWTERAAHLMLVLTLFDVVFALAAALLSPHVLES